MNCRASALVVLALATVGICKTNSNIYIRCHSLPGKSLMYEACLCTKKLRKQLFTQTTGCMKTDLRLRTYLSFCQLAAH